MLINWFLKLFVGKEFEHEQVIPEPVKEKTEYEKLCEKIQSAESGKYLLSKDEYRVLCDYCNSGQIALDDYEFRKKNDIPFTMVEETLSPFFEFVREPCKNIFFIHDKQIIPNWTYQGKKYDKPKYY